MTQAAIEQNKKIHAAIRDFKVTPYEEVSKRLDEATKKTIERLRREDKQEQSE